jgi:hypothetical protein
MKRGEKPKRGLTKKIHCSKKTGFVICGIAAASSGCRRVFLGESRGRRPVAWANGRRVLDLISIVVN